MYATFIKLLLFLIYVVEVLFKILMVFNLVWDMSDERFIFLSWKNPKSLQKHTAI